MMSIVLAVAFFASAALGIEYTNDNINVVPVAGGVSGSGHHTGYWDCCKPSCSWIGNDPEGTTTPVRSCAADGSATIDAEEQSGCADVGSSYMCSDQTPTAINASFAIGYTAASFAGGTDYTMCCRCVLLTWTQDTQDPKRQILVQITNTGGDLLENQFDLAIPGCGVGYNADGCTNQWGIVFPGAQYGGVSTEDECSGFPAALQDGCKFRFEWMDVPDWTVSFQEVECPAQLTSVSGCVAPAH